jgi:acyl-CoA synthetase (AMP-forming)/AMP-acid ligase II
MDAGCDLWLMTPEHFVRRPLEYLRCFGQRGGALTALPPFGLDHITRRVKPDSLAEMNFSGVKAFVVGAELIQAETLRRFERLLTPFGLRRGALLPAYGLAEATLAVSAVRPGETWTTRSPRSDGCEVVGCGKPLRDIDVRVESASGIRVPDGRVGEILIRGASVAQGYNSDGDSPALTRFENETLYSGDAGFLEGGQLFPVGRLGDSLRIRGNTIFAELLEAALSEAGYPRRQNTIVLGMREGRPVAIWISEGRQAADDSRAISLLTRMTEGAEIVRAFVGQSGIPRTSSGKPRRRLLWTAFLDRRLSGIVSP